jgi:dipeptidyl aminopeptidase/acylaminoacyl peptidase
MSLKTWIAALAALFLGVAAACAAPLDDYGRLPTLSDIALSPNGATFAYIREDEAKRYIVIQSIGVPQPIAVLGVGSQKVRMLQWADESHLLITTSVTTLPLGLVGHRSEFFTAQSFDTKDKSLDRLLRNYNRSMPNVQVMNVVAGVPQPRIVDGHTYVFVRGVYFPDRQGRYALFRVDLTTDETRMVSADSDTHAEDWVIDNAGTIVAEENYFESEQHWKLRIYHDGEPSNVIDVSAPIESPEIEGLNEDGTAVVVGLPQADNWPKYEQISLKDGNASPWQRSDRHLDGLISDNWTGRVIGGPRFTDKSDYVFFDPHAEKMWRSIQAAFKDAVNVDLISNSEDWTKFVVLVFGPAYGDTYFFVDMTAHKAYPIGAAYDGINDIAPVKWIDYRAADGRVIHAYLTLPLSREPKALPLIVLPHGGPQVRDEPGFDWISQALASRGYAVLQPEFRGSGGFGRDLLSAGFGEFGRKMQTDLSDGVRALAAQGLIDPKRVCIVGGSYGGYAALAGATLDTGVYRCAVSVAGLSDLSAQLEYWHWPHNTLDDRNTRFWDRFLGVESADDPKLDTISPIKQVGKVSIPILLIHGRDDTVVPVSQSANMFDALKQAGKQVQFVELDGEDHWLSRSETRRQMLDATVKFLEENDPPK